ncbi:hypothetical protein EDB83DRAFT_2681154 [Lactarius deliciosus]|nr:hypothetical protein EDB83DRAFT_2681154 [Lactarius deliciosus]
MPRGTSYIIYDLPGNATKYQAWSPNVWKTRIILNYKSIPHKTEWVEIGAPHTVLLHGGQPLYTVPILHDPTTERSLSGSLQIAFNLKRMYPDALPLFARHGGRNHSLRCPVHAQRRRRAPAAPRAHLGAAERGEQALLPHHRERMLGQSLESLTLPGAQAAARCARHSNRSQDADAREQSEAFLLGERETYADVVAACWLAVGRRIWGTDTQEWAETVGAADACVQEMGVCGYPVCADVAKCVLFSPFLL